MTETIHHARRTSYFTCPRCGARRSVNNGAKHYRSAMCTSMMRAQAVHKLRYERLNGVNENSVSVQHFSALLSRCGVPRVRLQYQANFGHTYAVGTYAPLWVVRIYRNSAGLTWDEIKECLRLGRRNPNDPYIDAMLTAKEMARV